MKYISKFLYAGAFLMIVVFIMSGEVMAFGTPEGGVCGNGICEDEDGEDMFSCPADCNPCGDGLCDEEGGETSITCNLDCSGPVCGDGTCDDDESIETCPDDCFLPDPQPDPGSPTPSCEDVKIHVGEETTCSIKVENVETFPLTGVTAMVVIPNSITKISNTDLWNCISTAEGTQCQKTYNPYLIMGEIEYLELTLTTDTEGLYGLSATINGQGETFQTVTYASSEQITITEVITATATADFLNNSVNPRLNYDVSANDILCSSGTTTFAYRDVYPGVSVTAFDTNTGVASFTVLCGRHLFYYDILCDGNVTSSTSVYNECS